jgi:hypothetical protein
MRYRTALPLAIAVAATAGLGTIAACDTTATGPIAGLGASGGGTAADSVQLVISPGSVSVTVGATFPLSTNAPSSLASQVVWASQEPSVASINPSGVVTALGAGTAIITAHFTSDTTNVGVATVTVVPAAGTASRLPLGDRRP